MQPRLVWCVGFLPVLLGCLAWVDTGQAWDDWGEETVQEIFERTVPFKPGGRLTLWNQNGRVAIQSWDRNEVKIWAKKRARARSLEEAEGLLEELEIEIIEKEDRLDIRTRHPRRDRWWGGRRGGVSVEYELTVPQQINLELETTNGGIDVEDINGRVEVNTTNGGIRVYQVRGAIRAETTNGGIKAELVDYNGQDDMRFATTNGGIDVRLPKGIKVDLDIGTTNGHIDTDFPVTVQGRISRKSLRAEINGGGPLLRLRTTNGSIRLRER